MEKLKKLQKSYLSLFIISAWKVFIFFFSKFFLKKCQKPPQNLLSLSESTNITYFREMERELHTQLQFHQTNNDSEIMYPILQYPWIWSYHKLE